MLQRRVYHVMAAVKRQLYVLGGNDLDYNNDRILVRHIDSYDMDMDQWTRCTFSLLTGHHMHYNHVIDMIIRLLSKNTFSFLFKM